MGSRPNLNAEPKLCEGLAADKSCQRGHRFSRKRSSRLKRQNCHVSKSVLLPLVAEAFQQPVATYAWHKLKPLARFDMLRGLVPAERVLIAPHHPSLLRIWLPEPSLMVASLVKL